MGEKLQKRKINFWGKPFDMDRNGKIDPAEAALIMMVFDDNEEQEKQERHENILENAVIDIDDMDIEGI